MKKTIAKMAAAVPAVLYVRFLMLCFPLPLTVGKGEKKIACVGDSITYSQGIAFQGLRRNLAFPSLVAKELGDEWQTVNYGMPARCLMSNGWFPYYREPLGKLSFKTDAQWVLFMLGTNDANTKYWDEERFENDLEDRIRQYQALPQHPTVVLMAPPPGFPENAKIIPNADIIREDLRPLIKKTAERLQLECIDLYELCEDHPEWFPDGLHPNKEGNRVIAKKIADVFRTMQ